MAWVQSLHDNDFPFISMSKPTVGTVEHLVWQLPGASRAWSLPFSLSSAKVGMDLDKRVNLSFRECFITLTYKSSNYEPQLHCYTVYGMLHIITFWKFRMRSCNIGLTYVFHSRQSIYLLIPKCWSKVFSSIENLFLQNDTMSIKFETHLFAASFAIWKRNTQFKI
jgi:hypothetical protein